MSTKSSAEPCSTANGVKTLVRNCRSTPAIPVTSFQAPSRSESADAKNRGTENKGSLGAEASRKNVNLAEPQLLSTLKMKENLKKMNAGIKSVRFEQKLPPDTHSKVSRKVNIKFDEKIYRDLIDLKVTEDDLGLRPITSGKTKEVTRPRDPVPELSDYYRPKFDKEYVVTPHPPSWPMTSVSRVPARPPGATSSVLRAVKRWSVDDNKVI